MLDPKKNSRRRITISFMARIIINNDPANYFFETKASKKWKLVLKMYMSGNAKRVFTVK